MTVTQEEIRRFIIDSLLIGNERTDLGADEPLTSSGLIDSLGMLRLIAHLEEQYQMEVGDGDVGDENFGTLSRLAAFVDRRRADS